MELERLVDKDWSKTRELKHWRIYEDGTHPCGCEEMDHDDEPSDTCDYSQCDCDDHEDYDDNEDERSDNYDRQDATPGYYYVKQSEQVYHGIL